MDCTVSFCTNPYCALTVFILTREALLTVSYSLLTSHLDYCNMFFLGLTWKSIQELQLVQNVASCAILNAPYYTAFNMFLDAIQGAVSLCLQNSYLYYCLSVYSMCNLLVIFSSFS